jgi:hypothetical protein
MSVTHSTRVLFHRNGRIEGRRAVLQKVALAPFASALSEYVPVTQRMLTNFLHFFGRNPDNEYEQAFVKEITVRQKPVRSVRVERIIFAGWLLITLKSAFIWWACAHYTVPIHPLWVIAPTVMFGLLCTAVYFGRR